MITVANAVQSLRPNSEWVLVGEEYSGLDWLDQVQSKPTEQEVKDMEIAYKIASLTKSNCCCSNKVSGAMSAAKLCSARRTPNPKANIPKLIALPAQPT